MSVQRAVIENRRASLREPFGRELLTKKFGVEGAEIVLEAFGVFRSGKHKGEPRGSIFWRKCTVGGWARNDVNGGGVQRPGSYDYAVGLGYERSNVVSARDDCLPREASDAEWHERLIRGLAQITDRWSHDRQAPISGFPRWESVHAEAMAERNAKASALLAEMRDSASTGDTEPVVSGQP